MRVVQIMQQASGGAYWIGLGALLLLLAGCGGNSIQITPSSAQVAAGSSLQLKATWSSSLATPEDVTSEASWSTSNSSVVTVSPTGNLSGVAAGSATVSAHLSGSSASINVTVTPAALVSIEVTPTSPSLPDGLTEQFTAIGVFADNSTRDLTQQVTWASSTPAIATISNAAATEGLLSAASAGSTTVSATSGNISGSTTVTITAATLVSIQVSPANPSIPKGVNRQFTATGVFSDNSTQNLTTHVTWSSSNTGVVTISNASGSQGLTSSAAPGTSTISASSGGITGGTTLTVTSATLVSIQVTPANPSIASGLTEAFNATGIYTDSSTQNLTTLVTWSSSNASVATISNASGSQGLASAAAAGSITVSATSGGVSGSSGLTVTAATLVSIQVTPANSSIADGLAEQLTATGIYSDSSTQNLTTHVTWSSSAPGVATISNASGSQGLASSAAVGSTTVSATSGSISGSTSLTVAAVSLVSIQITPANSSIADGLAEQLTATGIYSDSSTQNLTTHVTWSSSAPGVATISNASGSQGLASSAAVGSTIVSATSGGISGSTGLTVTAATLMSIQITPANPSIANGVPEQFSATGIYTDNSTQNLTTHVTWASSASGVASVSNAVGSQGLASSAGTGSTVISATNSGISGSTTLMVTTATLLSIAVTPAASSIPNGETEQLTATGTYTDSSTQNLTAQLTWSSSDSSVVTVSNAAGSQGLASSAGLGNATISATNGTISGSTALTVTTCANGFIRCEMITIDHTKVGNSDSSNFPMLFSGTYSYLATAANGGSVENTVTQQGITVPADAVFTSDSDCTAALNWEVESYDPTTGAAIIWVQIPTLSHAANTVIYLCVGKSSVGSFLGGSTGAAWDSNYQAVYHFPTAMTLGLNDSTVNGYNGTNDGATAIGSQIGIGMGAGSTNYVSIPLTNYPSPSRTIEWWEYNYGAYNDGNFYEMWGGTGSAGFYFLRYITNYLYVGWVDYSGADDRIYIPATEANFPQATWIKYDFTWVAGGMEIFYANGVEIASLNGLATTYNLGISFDIGTITGSNMYSNANFDEFRISATNRSADWITASYNNQSSPATFYTVTAQN